MRTTTLTLLLVAFLGNLPLQGQQKPTTSDTPQTTKKSEDKEPTAKEPTAKKKAENQGGWKSLLPEKGLEGWEVTDFGGQGEVTRKEDQLVFERGGPMTGINYKKGDFPKDNYEIELEAQRIDGSDFLCGLTFPVGKEFCSLIAGGWGGGVVGLSSVDGYDASENATSLYKAFDNNQWYKFRVRVTPQAVTAWIDDKEAVQQEREGHEFSTRIEVYVSQPLGYCVFDSKVAVRNFRWRSLQSQNKAGE